MTTTAHIIARAQLPHLGHFQLIKHALHIADHVQVILGSAGTAPNPDNPFSPAERKAMIQAALPPECLDRVQFAAQRDRYDNALWLGDVRALVGEHHKRHDGSGRPTLVGVQKDASSDYLTWFPEFELDQGLGLLDGLSSTPLRSAYFTTATDTPLPSVLKRSCPPAVIDWLAEFRQTPGYQQLARYTRGVLAYRKDWGRGPFYTGDAIISCNGHILMIRRDGDCGNGQLALPGGFREPGEDGVENALRECNEETSLIDLGDVTLQDLLAARGDSREFGHPSRSPRAHLITCATVFDLGERPTLPRVKSQRGEVQSTIWVPREVFPRLERECFEDHSNIISTMLRMALPSITI